LSTDFPVSEIELMQRIFESDSDAMEILYSKYAPLLYTFVKKILGDKEAAEKTMGNIFRTLQKKINYFDFETGNSYAWIITLAKNMAVYDLRKKKSCDNDEEEKNEAGNDLIIPHISHLSEPYDLEKALGYKDKIEEALNGLTDAQQYVIYLAFYEGLRQDEIAEKLKIPLQTVKSKTKISLIKFNENFYGSPHPFSLSSQAIDMIYPYVLGCLKNSEMMGAYDTFKFSEVFAWKLLGEYQNLVSLLPAMLDLEELPPELENKIMNKIYQLGNENKEVPVNSHTSEEENLEPEQDEIGEEIEPDFDKIESSNEPNDSEEQKSESEQSELKPAIPNKVAEGEPEIIAEEILSKYHYPPNMDFEGKRNYTAILTFVFVLILIVATVITYLFYRDRSAYYESQIETLNERLQSLVDGNRDRPEIPGLGELNSPQTIELKAANEPLVGSGEIILSFDDKRGYLHILNLPKLDSESAYQLWGNFDGEFVSLGVFKVSARADYYPFTLPQSAAYSPVEFYVIESPSEGSRKPGANVYLMGKL
jgi:RNA polymerase sigma factor (sigma-70 family)